jgi:DNA polymerase elongation subunit (family B)
MVEFQALTWHGRDIETREFDADGIEQVVDRRYVVDAYGRTATGQSVCVHVAFTPYFFARVENTSDAKISQFKRLLQERLSHRRPSSNQWATGPQKKTAVPKRPDGFAGISIESRKRFYGFTNGAKEKFLLVRCRSQAALRRATALAADEGLELYESNVAPELRLLHVRDLPAVGWVRCDGAVPVTDKSTICDIELCCDYKQLHPIPHRHDNAPLVVASFDLECVSENGGFPNALERGCPIIQIATTFWRITEPEPYKRHLACLGAVAALDGVTVAACKTEPDLLLAWAAAVRAEQADILTGYNIFGFDWQYIFDRAALHGALGRTLSPAKGNISMFPYMVGGKRTDHLAEIQVRKLESTAYGSNEFCVPSTPGVLQVDMLAVIKKDFKLTSYKLDAVAEHFLGDRKVDLPIKEMFALWHQGTPDAVAEIARYCVKDTELPIKLMRKLAILPNMMEMAKAVSVPMDYLVFRGQQIKVFSVILKKARLEGFVCPTKPLVAKSDKYVGATVLQADVGAHFGRVACLDFASLYPSIIRAHSMCHSTIVLDDAKYGNVEGVTYETHDLGDGGAPVKFAVAYNGKPVPALLPALLKDLAEHRKDARVLQKEAKARGDDFLAGLYNAKQLAYKVTMNSLYGFCGAANGLLPCVPIAAAVTTVGRSMIARTKELVESMYAHLGAKVVYGDSVAGYTPVMVRVRGSLAIVPVEELDALAGSCWTSMDGGKEACQLTETEAWTEAGWTKVDRVIRHAYNKPLVRIVTHSGLVDVTHDHSLLLPDGKPVSPKAVETGSTQLLHAARLPQSATPRMAITVEEARIIGMYFGGRRQCSLSRWALTASSRAALEPYKALCNSVYPGHTWSIYQTMDSMAAPFSMFPFDMLGPWASSAAYADIAERGIVPIDILEAPQDVQAAFLAGLKDAAAGITVGGHWLYKARSQATAMSLFMLAESLGYQAVLISTSEAVIDVVFAPKPGCFKLSTTVKKMFEVPCRGFVYDLTTANHHFHAGVGRLVVHNTDSVMCDFQVEDLKEAFRLGEEAARRITAEFKAPIMLEFEKVMSPFLLYSKKRYASLKFTEPDPCRGVVEAKGISLVRRDSCVLVRDVTKRALDHILIDRQPELACSVIHQAAAALLSGQVPVRDLVMSKALRAQYKAGILQPHDVVRAKIAMRSPGEEPRPGDRVEFVYVEGREGIKQTSITCRAEDPQHVQEAGLLVDLYHYLALLKSALADTVDVLKPALDKAFAEIGEEVYLQERRRRQLHDENLRSGQREITTFFGAASRDPAKSLP